MYRGFNAFIWATCHEPDIHSLDVLYNLHPLESENQSLVFCIS